jgi:hypothetical protein
MTPAVLDRPAPLFERPAIEGGLTLEERLNSVLHEARTTGSTQCPVCRARMTSTRASAQEAAAECGGCGSRLS